MRREQRHRWWRGARICGLIAIGLVPMLVFAFAIAGCHYDALVHVDRIVVVDLSRPAGSTSQPVADVADTGPIEQANQATLDRLFGGVR